MFVLFSEEYVPGAARKGMEWQYFVGDCSDPAVQLQAKNNFIIGFNEVFGAGDPEFCQKEKICELDNIVITCGKTQRRKRRNAQVSLESTKQNHLHYCIPGLASLKKSNLFRNSYLSALIQ